MGDRRKKVFPFLILISLIFLLPLRAELKYTTMDWKDGAKAGVCITFDWEDDYPHSIYVPGRTADLKGDLPEKTDRILSILDGHDTRATFFVVGIVAEEFRESFEQIRAEGHEIASHGDYHRGYNQTGVEDPQEIPNFGDQDFDEQIIRMEEAERLMKSSPTGFRAPGLNFNDDTLLALESLGYLYDSSLQTTHRIKPFHPVVNNEQLALLEIPVTSGEDASSWDLYGRKYDGPDPNKQWKKDFEEVYNSGGVYVPLLHPAFIGKDSRLLATLEEFLEHVQSYNIWMTTMNDLATWHMNKEQLHVAVKNPRGTISILEIENNGGKIDGLTVEVDGKVRAFGRNILVSHVDDGENGFTKITFMALEGGKTRVVLVRV